MLPNKHAAFIFLDKSGEERIAMSAGVIIWALIVANVTKPWGFHSQRKHTL